MEDAPKKIEVVNGDGKDLEISPVYKHLSIEKPKKKEEKKKEIVIPKEKKKWGKPYFFFL